MTSSFRIVWLFPIVIVGCAKGKSVVETDPDLGYKTTYTVERETGMHNGPYTKTDSTGLLLEKGNYSMGVQEGVRELYYPDGKVKIRERYKKGKMDDLYELFFPDGRHELKGYYVDGAMYGLWKKYDQEGHLLEEVNMINNEEMGPFKEYFPNGNIQAEGTYLHGPNEDGRLKLYEESGQLQKEMLCYAGRCYTIGSKK